MTTAALRTEPPTLSTAFSENGQARAEVKDALVNQIERELSLLLEDFNTGPSRAGLFEVGTVAEVVVLGRTLPSGQRLARLIGAAGSRWAGDGLLEDVCFAEAQMVYHAALVLLLARPVPGETLQALSSQGMIGRSEWPALTQLCVSTMLEQCGVGVPLPETEIAEVTACIDKRCLRAQSGEYDLSLLLTTAQLLGDRHVARLRPSLLAGAPRVMPRLLLVQALRMRNWNWAAVLAFLCARSFGLPAYLDQALRRAFAEVPAALENLDLPKEVREQTEYFSRSARALRLRGAAALAMYLDCCQEQPS